MGYLPTFTTKNQPNVGKYIIHGWYGIYIMFVTLYASRIEDEEIITLKREAI